MSINLTSMIQVLLARPRVPREEGQALIEPTLILGLVAFVVTAAFGRLVTAAGNVLMTS